MVDQKRRGNRAVTGKALRWALVAVTVVFLARFLHTGWPEVRASLALLTADQAPYVVLAIGVEVLWLLAMSQVYRSALLAFGGTLTRPAAVRVSMAAFTLSRVLPGGGAAGGAVAARELIALGNPALRTVASMLTSWWITMTALTALVFGGILASTVAGTLPSAYLTLPAVAFGGFVVGGVALSLAARSPRTLAPMMAFVARAAARMQPGSAVGAHEPPTSVGAGVRRTGLLPVLAWGIAVWVFDATALWLSLAAFGWHTDLGVLLVGYGVANLISALPELTPGWLGVIEASVAVTLAALGVPRGTAVVGVLVYRLVSYWLPAAAGAPAAVRMLRGTRPASPQSRRRAHNPSMTIRTQEALT